MKNIIGPFQLVEQEDSLKWYTFSISMLNIETVFYNILFLISLNFFSKKNLKFDYFNLKISPKVATMLSVSFFLLSFISFLQLTQNTIGIIDWIKDPRTGYQFYRVGNGHFYALALLFITFSYIINTMYSKGGLLDLIKQLLYGFMFYIFGSKQIIIGFFSIFLITKWFKSPKTVKYSLILVVSAMSLLLIANFGSSSTKEITGYFDYHNNSAMVYEWFSHSERRFNGEILSTQFWQLVPRGIYPDKPFVYGDILLREIFWPGAAENTHTPGMAGPVNWYGDFGVSGVLFSSIFQFNAIISAFLTVFLLKKIKEKKTKDFLFLISFSFLFSEIFMKFFVFPMNILMILVLFILSFIIKKLNVLLPTGKH